MSHGSQGDKFSSTLQIAAANIDPVCGMIVAASPSAISVSLDGRPYYFCCQHCRQKFIDAPQQFLNRGAFPIAAKPAAGSGNIYICPMDPEVREEGPGICPKCGMALEPAVIQQPSSRTE
jgi:P-type Cu+ transporter